MGYTHYWYRKADFTKGEWMRICKKASDAIMDAANSGITIAGPAGDRESVVVIGDDAIAFNGLSKNSHESFILRRDAGKVHAWQSVTEHGTFNFCKTARKPYDEVVVKVLRAAYLASGKHAITLDSDGGVFDDLFPPTR